MTLLVLSHVLFVSIIDKNDIVMNNKNVHLFITHISLHDKMYETVLRVIRKSTLLVPARMHTSRPVAPTLEQLREISIAGKLELSDNDLKDYQDAIASKIPNYQRLYDLKLSKPDLKYPRSSGYKPQAEENKYNGWYWRADIKGASTGKLHGKRIAIKDSIFVAGVPMMNGSLLMEGFIPEEDATVVTRVLDHGGHILGKATCEELCISGSSFTCAEGPVLNPNDVTMASGGSSSGNAVLIYNGDVDMAIGSDQAGSVRTPSSWTGIVGLKPTYGLVPYTGAMSMDPTIDHLGPMARTVKDCALLLEAIAGYNGDDPRQPANLKLSNYTNCLNQYTNLNNTKIGILKEGFEISDDNVKKIVQDAIKVLEVNTGVVATEISVPQHKDGFDLLWFTISRLGFYKNALENAGASSGLKGRQNAEAVQYMRSSMETKLKLVSPSVKFAYLFGKYMTQNYGLSMYVKAQNMVAGLVEDYNEALSRCDVLVMPTVPHTATKLPTESLTPPEFIQQASGMQRNTAPFSVTGHPALSINAGYTSEGLPVGLQIVGRHWDEATVLKVAYALEQRGIGVKKEK